MKIILLTQDDPFYLSETIEDFIKKVNLTKKHQIVTAIITDASPFGKKESFLKKTFRTYQTFGFRFFLFYTLKYIYRKLILRKNVFKVFDKYNVPTWHLKTSINKKENVARLQSLKPDVIAIIAGNQIIKNQVLEVLTYGVINAHSSLLPEYKGLMPTFWVLKNNEKKTGVTVFKLTTGIDDGPIINQKEVEIGSMTQSQLVQTLKYVANDLLIEAFDLLDNPDNFKNNTGGSYYKFPTKKDVREFYKSKKRFF